MDLRIRQAASLGIRQKFKMIPRIRLAALMEMPEGAFNEFVRRIEQNELFRKLAAPSDKKNKVIRFAHCSGRSFLSGLLQFREDLNRDAAGCDVETLLDGKKELLALIRDLGQQRFEELFLANEECLSPGEIGARCGLAEKDVERINELVNEVALHDAFFHPAGAASAPGTHYHQVAVIERDGAGGLAVTFGSTRFFAGKYVIDKRLLATLKSGGYFSKDEADALDTLLKEIELVNQRRSTLYRILQQLIVRQKKYLLSGKGDDLLPYTQKEMARETGIDESLICRALQHRSVRLPDGGEKPLKHLFASRKSVIKRCIGKIVAGGAGERLTDRQVTARLRERYGIAVSRRTVNAYKKLT